MTNYKICKVIIPVIVKLINIFRDAFFAMIILKYIMYLRILVLGTGGYSKVVSYKKIIHSKQLLQIGKFGFEKL